MKKIIHRSESRGLADHGWLVSRHTFSFGAYRNPERIHFGMLRVLNDDIVAPGMGFGRHPHDNMEIISVPLSGDLRHQDSMGNTTVIRQNDIQIMSAGTGVEHSEMNNNRDREVRFLQIWIFPDVRNLEPSYGQITLDPADRAGKFQPVITPAANHQAGTLAIHQQAWFHLGKFETGHSPEYHLKNPGNGLYVFVLSGTVKTAGEELGPRDGLGIYDADRVEFSAVADSEILLMEVPMPGN